MNTTITNIDQLDLISGIYTYADYLMWKIKDRLELLKGKIFKMSAPSPAHQKVATNLTGEFYHFFKKRPCEVYVAPFDVRLPVKDEKGDKISTIVQPDLCVVCDLSKIDSKGCEGAPDLVVEILSPGNSKKEMNNKFALYEEAGVQEYWLVHPLDSFVLVYTLENGVYRPLKHFSQGNVTSVKFPELSIAIEDIFRKVNTKNEESES